MGEICDFGHAFCYVFFELSNKWIFCVPISKNFMALPQNFAWIT